MISLFSFLLLVETRQAVPGSFGGAFAPTLTMQLERKADWTRPDRRHRRQAVRQVDAVGHPDGHRHFAGEPSRHGCLARAACPPHFVAGSKCTSASSHRAHSQIGFVAAYTIFVVRPRSSALS